MSAAVVEQRRSVRALLVDPDDRVLLLSAVSDRGVTFWFTPGGGVEPGESDHQALQRELREEVVLDVDAGDLGPAVWVRRIVWGWRGRRIDQAERIHLVRVEAFAPRFVGADADEAAAVGGARWWTPAELTGPEAPLTAPSRLGPLLVALLRDGRPATPVDVGR